MNHTIYVSPNGNDAASGHQPEPGAKNGEGPLRTLPAAQKAVRRIKAGLKEPAEIRVILRGGLYELDETWWFHAEDGGFGRASHRLAKVWPVTWAAYEGEEPVISGGRRIAGPWKKETVNGKTAYTTTPPKELLADGGFTQLWVNGGRRERPRLPKKGLWQTERGIDTDFSGWGHNHPSTAFVYREDQLKADWKNLQDVELHLFGWWIDQHVKIDRIDQPKRTVHFDRTSRLRMEWGPGDGVDFVVENVFEALTEPGEWYLDRPAGKLYYLPMPGEDMDQVEVIAGRLSRILEIDGGGREPSIEFHSAKPKNPHHAEQTGGFLRFEGLTFAHGEWRLPDHEAGDAQAAASVPAAVRVRRAESCVFANCRIEHVATYGAEFLDGTVESGFERCALTDLGAGGVRIWHGCRRNFISDCEIGPGGLIHASACGVLIGKSTGNRVEHNHIHDFFYTGVSAGWTWGYAESEGYGNIIEWNHIHHLGKGLLSDMGGIYLLGHASGTRLRYNHIHDIECRRYGGWAMYTDEGSTEVLMESNCCYRTNRNAYHQHYGRRNTLRNNILAYGGDAVVAYGKPEEHLGLIFERNILLSDHTPILRSASPERWTTAQTHFQGNLYWCENGEVSFERGSIAHYATQPFPIGYLDAARKIEPMGEVPEVGKPPQEDGDWKTARCFDGFVNGTGSHPAPEGLAEMRLLRVGGDLHLRGRLRRPGKFNPMTNEAIWNREHLEFFFKPYPDAEVMVQIGVDASGEIGLIGHGIEATDDLKPEARVTETAEGWEVHLRIPIDRIAALVPSTRAPEWGFLGGFAVAAEVGDFASWQAQGHDPEGRVADPLFVDPAHGDFRFQEGSPALAMGFIPWDITRAGPR